MSITSNAMKVYGVSNEMKSVCIIAAGWLKFSRLDPKTFLGRPLRLKRTEGRTDELQKFNFDSESRDDERKKKGKTEMKDSITVYTLEIAIP